ncbi:ABC transporter permease [Sinanaerobacter chloroacetimidivorans]|uniref:FtsX-like permease family protein n=1 Tax=Sinanaerobacter chloroacetimidivorans TaxID=2818044 RepID=A0A8J7W571_9FIRM|nr:ABC transporter permease [Sinanaerobacter chloroacetimidivorans]MBR0599400.1 FtsX-like permease family protein [Sinanaerobacter chloroacetimidivorans]
MIINKRIRRVLLESKAQYIGSIVLIIFSCFAFTLMTQFAGNFEQLAYEFQNEYIQEDVSFTTEKNIENLQDLESAANAVIEEGKTLDYKVSEEQTLRIFSQNEKVNLPAVLEGRELGGRNEILLSPNFAAANNYHIGEEIRILDQSFTIAGFMALPNYIYPLQSEMDMMPHSGFGVAVISKDDFHALANGSSFYQVKFNPSDQNHRIQAAEFRELLESRNIDVVQWTDIEDNKRVSIVAAEIDILHLVSRAVPTGILLLASIMVGNVIGRMINHESTIIGALYALGYKKRELYLHYLKFPFLIAVIGGIVGTLLGFFPVRYMVSFMFTAFTMPMTGITFHPGLILLSLLLPILFLGVSGYFVIRKELKHSPVELMKGEKEENKVNFLEHNLKLERFKFSAKFKIREQLRSLSRLAFLLVGIAVATILLQWGFTLKSSTDFLFAEGSNNEYNFKYEYKFDKLRFDELPQEAEPFSASLFLPVNDEKRDFYVTGVPSESALLTLEDEKGNRLSTNQVIVTKPVARLLNIKEGDSVNIVRKLDGHMFSVKIDRIADTYSGKFLFMPLGDYNEKFGMPEGSYNGSFSNVQLDIPEDQAYSVVSIDEKLAGAQEAFEPVKSMIGGLSTVAFIIGMIVIYVVTSLIIEENKNIISLMKIFGYRKREINSLILNSSTLVVVIGYIIGIPLTISAIGVLQQSLETSVGMVLPPPKIDLLYILIGFIVVLLSYELSKLLCKKKVNAISMSEALKSGME